MPGWQHGRQFLGAFDKNPVQMLDFSYGFRHLLSYRSRKKNKTEMTVCTL